MALGFLMPRRFWTARHNLARHTDSHTPIVEDQALLTMTSAKDMEL